MLDFLSTKDTICAVASPAGTGAVSVIRVSGLKSWEILLLLCPGLLKKKIESHRVFFTKARSIENLVIDEVLVTFFENKKSYTGESSVEIGCHGNPFITEKILKRLCYFGARLAYQGEFTYRAFMNDKIDLIQAEAVLSVLGAHSEASLRIGLRQLEGDTSRKFVFIEDELTWCLAHAEAAIDFSTENLEVIDKEILFKKLSLIKTEIEILIQSYLSGRVLKDGLRVAFVGRPNVGKSSLLNKLVMSEKAIVTDIAGTTRDVIESVTVYENFKITLFDTAGIRKTEDVVEKIGVERSLQSISNADVCVFIFDASEGLISADLEILKQLKTEIHFNFSQIFLVGNKSDKLLSTTDTQRFHLHFRSQMETLQKSLPNYRFTFKNADPILISCLNSNCRKEVLSEVITDLESFNYLNESVISSARQFEDAQAALSSISEAMSELESGMGYEFVAQTLKTALISIQKILGHSYDDQIMDRIFKEFCLGK